MVKTGALLAAGALISLPPAMAGDIVLGPVIGGSLLRHGPDTSSSHGAARSEVTLGRSPIIGILAGAAFANHNEIGVEVAYAPYHNDVYRGCVVGNAAACQLQPLVSVSRALLYTAQYKRLLSDTAWKPYLGTGAGLKVYSYEEGLDIDDRSSLTFSAAAGIERATSCPVSLEARVVVVRRHPMLFRSLGPNRDQVELQVRAAVSLVRRR